MAKPSRERVRRWRERKAKKGGRSLSTWLEPETVRMMDYLLNYYGETAAPLVARAIANLYDITCQDADEAPGTALDSEQLAAEPQVPVVEDHSGAVDEEGTVPDEMTQLSEPSEPEQIAGEESLIDEFDPLLLEIKTKLAEGTPARNVLRTLVVEWIKSMKANGVSFETMADKLNAAEIPTLSGRGQWEQGMIPTILLLSSY